MMKNLRILRATAPWAAAAVLGSLACMPAFSATANTTFSVTANVVTNCTVSASSVAFGTYSTSQLDGTGSISVTCTNLAPYTVELDAGTGTGATVSHRKMTGPSSQALSYNLYQDSSRTALWGTQSAQQAVAGTGSGTAQSLTVYGRVAGAQTPGAGSYSDTITVTVTY
jgi:spore coat protein U-like protein